MFLVSFKIFFKRKNLFLFFEKLNRTLYGLKFFPKIMTVFPSKNKQRLFWINICFRPVKLTSVSAALWKLDTCIVFCRCLFFFPFSRCVFYPKLFLFCNIRQWDKSCFSCNIIPNKRALFPFFKTSNNSATQTTIKQARFYKPCICDKQLGFNKPAAVIADSLFADFRHLCFNGCLCDMRHIRSKSGFGTNTPQIAGARP